MTDVLRKFVRVENDAKLGERQIRIIASDATPDLAKDIMVPQGCDTENYRSNPIILAQHDPNYPIAKAQVEIVNGRVEALIEFPPSGISAKADEYCGLAKAGIINAASVGFEGIEAEPIKGGGVRYNKWRLLEISLVSVPCNPSALVIARSAPQVKADGAKWKVGASRNLSIDEDESWDGPAAEASIFEHCSFDGDKPDTRFARKGFLVYDESAPTLKGSYKLPFAKVKDGRLVALKSGIRADASRLPQTDIPDDVKEKARAVIDHYEAKFKDDGKGVPAMTIKSAAIIRKGMYGVANLASMLEDLGWAVMSSTWEAEMEGDGSKVPGMLADGLRQLADAFVAMSQEEVSELLASVAPDGDKAVRTAKLKSLLPLAQKAGRRFSQANQDHLDAIEKCTKAMDACREKMADIHDDAVGHTEEMKGHVDEMKGHLKSMKGNKAADNSAAIDGMGSCTDKMASTCQKIAHLHDYLHDHIAELEQHVEEATKHVKAMQDEDDEDADTDGKKKPDDGSGGDGDDDDNNSDGELAFEIEQRKRVLALLTA
jgi:HK97 family phage prohead protease